MLDRVAEDFEPRVRGVFDDGFGEGWIYLSRFTAVTSRLISSATLCGRRSIQRAPGRSNTSQVHERPPDVEIPKLYVSDVVYVKNIGAYSSARAVANFNGFAPAKIVMV